MDPSPPKRPKMSEPPEPVQPESDSDSDTSSDDEAWAEQLRRRVNRLWLFRAASSLPFLLPPPAEGVEFTTTSGLVRNRLMRTPALPDMPPRPVDDLELVTAGNDRPEPSGDESLDPSPSNVGSTSGQDHPVPDAGGPPVRPSVPAAGASPSRAGPSQERPEPPVADNARRSHTARDGETPEPHASDSSDDDDEWERVLRLRLNLIWTRKRQDRDRL